MGGIINNRAHIFAIMYGLGDTCINVINVYYF